MRAGVLPVMRGTIELKDGTIPPPGVWRIIKLHPTAYPIEKLAYTLLPNQRAVQTKLVEELRKRDQILSVVLSKMMRPESGQNVLILVDQFEELFTLCESEQDRKRFIENLIEASNHANVKVIITMRADFYGNCLRYQSLRLVLDKSSQPIGPMARQELVDAILLPAQKGGWTFQAGLWEMMLEAVENQPGTLPLLSHALLETWKRRRGRTLTLSGYREAGEVKGAIAHTAQQVFNRLEKSEQEIAQRVFLSLTELDEAAEDTRRISNLNELVELLEKPENEISPVLQKLADARLITTNENGEIEVAHEALIRNWPRLRRWLREGRENLEFERRLAADAATWDDANRDKDLLYRGARLAQSAEVAARVDIQLTQIASEFLEASHDLANQEIKAARQQLRKEIAQQRKLAAEQKERADAQTLASSRLRWMLIASSTLIVALIGISLYLVTPIVQARQAKKAATSEIVIFDEGIAVIGTDEVLADPSEKPEWRTEIDSFGLEVHEVTNDQYKRCIEHGNCSVPNNPALLEQGDDLPVVNLNAFQAAAFCEWIDRRLPTEIEWEYAARGGDGLKWPSGNTSPQQPPCYPNCQSLVPANQFLAEETSSGIRGMVGNVWEWTSTYYSADYSLQLSTEWDGKSELTKNDSLIIRGGSMGSTIPRITYRQPVEPFSVANTFGVRCAVDPQ